MEKSDYLNFNDAYIMEQLFDNGYVEQDLAVVPDRLIFKIRNDIGRDTSRLDEKLRSIPEKTSNINYVQELAMWSLASVLISVNNLDKNKLTVFKSIEEAREYLDSLSTILIDIAIKLRRAFDRHLKKLLNSEEIEKHFFDVGGLPPKPEPQLKDSTSENPAA